MSYINLNEQKQDTLWDNPMTRAAMKSMSAEDLQRYKEIGQAMYGDIDFEGTRILNNIPPPMEEAVAYISESLKSGLHPSMMEQNEIELIKDVYGEKWYENWGYKKEDINEIFTVVKE